MSEELVFRTEVEKCPTCGADAIHRSEYWEAIEGADEMQIKLHKIKSALYQAYAKKYEHSVTNPLELISKIESIMQIEYDSIELEVILQNKNLRKCYGIPPVE